IGVLLSAGFYILWELPASLADAGSLPAQLGLAAVKGITLGWVAHRGKNVLAPVLTRTVMEWTAYI
ncbi:MAG: hypothetical protein U1B80_10725, partial [Anaerolineaceae bacterium]|nr:hypothetical protein [Anaerolineaceae bacterium]